MIWAAGNPLKWGTRSGPVTYSGCDHRRQAGPSGRRLDLVYSLVMSAGSAAVGGVGLEDDVPHPAVLVELADRDRAELGLQGAVDILDRNPEKHRLRAVDFGPQLLRGGAEGRVQAAELGPLSGLGEKLLRDLVEPLRISGPLVLDPELEAARGADAGNRRRRDRDEPSRPRCSAAPAGDVLQHRLGVFLAGALQDGIALLEVLERHEKGRRVGLVLAVDQAVAVDDGPCWPPPDSRRTACPPGRMPGRCGSGSRRRA